jgi:hypothetical protein
MNVAVGKSSSGYEIMKLFRYLVPRLFGKPGLKAGAFIFALDRRDALPGFVF